MNDEHVIIGLAGRICSGKETVAGIIAEKIDSGTVNYSDILRSALRIFCISETREHLQEMSRVMRSAFGQKVLETGVAQMIEALPQRIVTLQGIRRLGDIEELIQQKNFYLVFIHAEQQRRYVRYLERKNNIGDQEMSWDEFIVRDSYETEAAIDGLSAISQFHIGNSGTRDELNSAVDRVVEQILEKSLGRTCFAKNDCKPISAAQVF